MSNKLYEISNPSDPYTFKAPDFKSACIAICILGHGKYGIEEIGGDKNGGSGKMPVFIFGGHDQWFEGTFGKNFKETCLEVSKSTLADILETVLIGSPASRKIFEDGLSLIPPDKHEEWRKKYIEGKRSSLNNIGKRAQELARELREQAREQAKEDK